MFFILKYNYMKQAFMQTTARLLTGAFLVLSLSQCTKEAMNHDDGSVMESKRAMQSMNLKKEYRASLGALNNSGVHGTATLMLEGNMLTVSIEAMGLEAGKPHPQHIHGFMENNRNSTCPTSAFDTNGDGLIDLGESVPAYGPILLDLAPMPTADAMGKVSYTKTFTINSNLLPLQNRAIVLHGLTVNGQYIATLPVACGQVMAWQ
jgi:Cu/Zn superoxide dismutase